VPLPIPVRVIDRKAYGYRIRSLIRAAGCVRTLVDPVFTDLLPEDVALSWDMPLPTHAVDVASSVGPERAAVIQFTSGSTAAPKGATLSHAAVIAAVWGLAEATDVDPDRDCFFSWLPFFHDYGLFCYLALPLFTGTDLVALPTERFAERPARWFQGLTRSRATWTGGPPGAWAVALRASTRASEPIDLSRLRSANMAAEMIDPALVERARQMVNTMRLDPAALAAGYGLAEATLTVTRTPPGHGFRLRLDPVDLEALARGMAEPAGEGPLKRVVSCGSPLPGTEVRIAGPRGVVPERQIGEIQVRGPSLMSGYVGQDVPDPFVDGWLQTGDLGYKAGGELYVTGRIKDIIIVLGQNYPPEDIEWAAGQVPGVRAGRTVAFGRPGIEGELVVAVEARAGADWEELEERVKAAVLAEVGLTPREVLVLQPGTIPKTTSGKLQRSAVREVYAASHPPPLSGAGRGDVS
jgi:fatty-acyl-CoA synthase